MEVGTPTTDSDYQSWYNNALTPTEKGNVLRQYKKQYPKLFCKSPWVDTALADAQHMRVSQSPPKSDIAPSFQGERDLTAPAPPKSAVAPLLLRYRSKVKRAILGQLILNPRATDLQICRGVDVNGTIELPATWRGGKDRLFQTAYMDHRKHKVEIAISKVRADMRALKLLPPR
jgi:hypothetical protein